MNDYQNILYILDFIAKGFLDKAVGFTILCTSKLLKITGLIFSKTRCNVELLFEFTKLINGVIFITPEIGKSVFYCKSAFINIAPRP
jgi:hypothetical protein